MKNVIGLIQFYDGQLFIVEDLKDISNSSIKVENYMLLWCLNGKGTLETNGKVYSISKNSLLICTPDVILEHGMVSYDFEFKSIGMSPQLMKHLSITAGYNWDMRRTIEDRPVFHLSDDEIVVLNTHYNLLFSKLNRDVKHKRDILNTFLQTFLFELYDILDNFISVSPPRFTSSEYLFKEFMDLVMAFHHKERNVTFYANRLNVTSKYLSIVCKRVSGSTAFDIINSYTIKDIKYMLTETRKTIKEISNELNFDNMSFFGKYVKRYLGMSPKHYREKYFNINNE